MRLSHWLTYCALGLLAYDHVLAGQPFVYPDVHPTIATQTPPAWLSGGAGDDGYLTVKAEIAQDMSCSELGNKGVLIAIGQKKMQVVVSIKTSGFKSNLDGLEIPIATFDGRRSPGECAVFSTLPLTVLPYIKLEEFSPADSGDLRIALTVASSTETDTNIVSAAQLVLGTAAVFATGGAASTIAGLTATVGKPALATAEAQLNKALSSVTPGESKIATTWPQIRSGIRSIVIPVYLGETRWTMRGGETPAQAIKRLYSEPASSKNKLFDVRLTFNYTKSLFDPRASGINDLPQADSIATTTVLNYPQLLNAAGLPAIPNFMQLLNNSSPSLLQQLAAATDLGVGCAKSIELLRQAGLNLIDRSVVVKAFVDEAKKDKPAWYTDGRLFASCFRNHDHVRQTVVKLFPRSGVVQIGDAQDGAADDPQVKTWADRVAPVLAAFRQVMEVNENREQALLDLNGQNDIEVRLFGPGAWQNQSASAPVPASVDVKPANAKDAHPGIARLAQKRITAGGCFIYGKNEYLKATTPGGYLVLVGEPKEFWVADVELTVSAPGRIRSVGLFKLTEDWKMAFKVSNTYPGGECPNIIANM